MPASQTRPRILVVDNEKKWHSYLQDVLAEEKKYVVDTAEDYRDASAELAEADVEGRPFALVTVDLALEGPSVGAGEMLLRHIKAQHKDISCIVVSGHESSPEQLSELVSTVSDLLRRRASNQSSFWK